MMRFIGGLGDVWKEIVFHRDMLTMMKRGYLCPLRVKQVPLGFNLDRIHIRAGDFATRELAAALRDADVSQVAVAAYKQHAAGRKALVFTTNVASAYEMAAAFRKAGVTAEALHGKTAIKARRETLARFRDGRTNVIVNCAVLTEGFDEPSISCIILARPTRSRPLFVQVIGRGTRTGRAKKDCLIIDLVGNSIRHEPISVASLFGLPPRVLVGRRIVHKAVRRKHTIDAPQKGKRVDGGPRRPGTGWTPLMTCVLVTLSVEFLCAVEVRL
jgi:superfamily II DNA or RNA helicase